MAEKKIIEIGADVSEALKDIKNLFNTMVKEEKEAQKQSKETQEAVKGIGKVAKTTEKEVGRISKGFKGLGLAIKAAGIGLVIDAMRGVKEIFSQNQRVVDAFSTVFETFSIVVNQVVTALIDTYDAVAKSSKNFDALGKVLSGLITIGLTPLKLSFNTLKLALLETQKAWENSFFGDKDQQTLDKLNQSIKETKQNINDIGINAINAGKDIAKNVGEAIDEVKNIGNIAAENLSKVSVTAALEQAKLNIELKNTAQIAVAQQSLLVEKYDILAEKQRQIRDEERNSISDRKRANDELNKILDEQEKAMLSQANLQIQAAENEKNKNNTIEAQVALIEALANKQGVLAQIEGFRSEQKANDLALDKELIELSNSKLESESKLSIEQKRFNAEQIEDELLRLEKLKEIDELEAQQETERLQAIVDNANAETQAKIDAQITLDEFTEQSRQQNITRDKEISDARENIRQQDLAREKFIQQQKLQITANAFGQIADILGKNSAAGKAAAIAQSTINTYQGITSVWATPSTLPEPFATISKIASTATVLASGLSAVKSIKSQKLPQGARGGSISSASAPSVAAPQAQAPQFNIVGQSSTDQLAGAIGAQNNQPIKAYVVSDDVTTAQQMDRSIIQGATI